MEKNVEEYLAMRVQDIAEEWEDDTRGRANHCESPVEQLFLIEWCYQIEAENRVPDGFPKFYIWPQYEIQNYRVDFLIYHTSNDMWMCQEETQPKNNKEKTLIVEIDSYLWHGKTPYQFEKEKKRERDLMSQGYEIMRFSGREIIRDVAECVEQVIGFFEKDQDRKRKNT